jgi:hypothetical protein
LRCLLELWRSWDGPGILHEWMKHETRLLRVHEVDKEVDGGSWGNIIDWFLGHLTTLLQPQGNITFSEMGRWYWMVSACVCGFRGASACKENMNSEGVGLGLFQFSVSEFTWRNWVKRGKMASRIQRSSLLVYCLTIFVINYTQTI